MAYSSAGHCGRGYSLAYRSYPRKKNGRCHQGLQEPIDRAFASYSPNTLDVSVVGKGHRATASAIRLIWPSPKSVLLTQNSGHPVNGTASSRLHLAASRIVFEGNSRETRVDCDGEQMPKRQSCRLRNVPGIDRRLPAKILMIYRPGT